MEGRDKDTLCQACGQYWQKYRDYRPLTVRQQGFAKARADEIAAASASFILESLSSIVPTQSPGTQAMMQAIMHVQRDASTVSDPGRLGLWA